MRKNSRTEIRVETKRMVTITAKRAESVCATCGIVTLLLTIEEAVQACALTSDAIRQAIADGSLHAQRLPDGHVHICADSLRSIT